jgi:glycine cleavage system H protein
VVSERYYTETHEWVTADEGVATVGITDYAQTQLGDVVFIELPAGGTLLEAGDTFGTIESVKSASDLIAPVAGSVVEANTSLTDHPERVNEDPFGQGWMIKVRLNGDLGEHLLDEAGYRAFVEAQQ